MIMLIKETNIFFQNNYSCQVGDSVIYKNEKKEYCEGKIKNSTREFMHSVYFVEEDELSDDILQKYITVCYQT